MNECLYFQALADPWSIHPWVHFFSFYRSYSYQSSSTTKLNLGLDIKLIICGLWVIKNILFMDKVVTKIFILFYLRETFIMNDVFFVNEWFSMMNRGVNLFIFFFKKVAQHESKRYLEFSIRSNPKDFVILTNALENAFVYTEP